MPPVLGPVSPSPTALWSWAEASGSAYPPSTKAKKLASSPSRNSSITRVAPAAPNRPAASASSIAASAWSSVRATVTPLPPVSPSALTTIGTPCVRTYAFAAVESVKRPYAAVAMRNRAQRSLANPLEPSNRAAAAVGPNARTPAMLNRSTRPAHSGASGPTTTSSMRCRRAKSTSRSRSSAAIGTQSASSAIPALPGAQYSSSHTGEAASAQASACSRPPEPTKSNLMAVAPLLCLGCAERLLYHRRRAR
jgi:hypothetical protein